MGCSPAEAVELIVQEDGNFFTVEMRSLKLHGSLRGGEQRIALVPCVLPNARCNRKRSLCLSTPNTAPVRAKHCKHRVSDFRSIYILQSSLSELRIHMQFMPRGV